MSYGRLDHSKLRTLPLGLRESKMSIRDILPLDYELLYKNPDIDFLARAIIQARLDNSQVIWTMGAHVIRQGNARMIIDLMKRGIITHVAVNAAVAIHDFELAFFGATLEDVEIYIKDGRFGNWEETGRYINEAVIRGSRNGMGFGEAIGALIENEQCGPMPHKDISVFASAFKLGVPITVHKGIGYDITDQHPMADFAAIGKTSGDDFLIFAKSVFGLESGVFLNVGSAVMGPEVYLKALSVARNLAEQEDKRIRHFTTAVFDLVPLGDWGNNEDIVNYKKVGAMSDPRYYFRPLKSILVRTVKDGGKGYYIQGDFKETIPALYRAIINQGFAAI